uniref:Uncharacterized protein n=1 Tax=Oryza glumipatula TaxID=40148 RepID=A0A0D9YKE2_9ORYZ
MADVQSGGGGGITVTAVAERDGESGYGAAVFFACLTGALIAIGVLMVLYYRSHHGHGALAVFLLVLSVFVFLSVCFCCIGLVQLAIHGSLPLEEDRVAAAVDHPLDAV